MFPVSANPRARTSKRGGRNRANARNTGTKYDAKPESPGMAFRTRTTSGPKPKPTLFTKYSPQTSPASNRAVRAVTSRCTARTGLCRYTPASFAKSFPVPIGTRSEEHTSELQSPCNLVCRLLLEKKKKKKQTTKASTLRSQDETRQT